MAEYPALEKYVEKLKADYLAANGHLMTTTEWNSRGERIQHSAVHSENCPCYTSEEGPEPLPDW